MINEMSRKNCDYSQQMRFVWDVRIHVSRQSTGQMWPHWLEPIENSLRNVLTGLLNAWGKRIEEKALSGLPWKLCWRCRNWVRLTLFKGEGDPLKLCSLQYANRARDHRTSRFDYFWPWHKYGKSIRASMPLRNDRKHLRNSVPP